MQKPLFFFFFFFFFFSDSLPFFFFFWIKTHRRLETTSFCNQTTQECAHFRGNVFVKQTYKYFSCNDNKQEGKISFFVEETVTVYVTYILCLIAPSPFQGCFLNTQNRILWVSFLLAHYHCNCDICVCLLDKEVYSTICKPFCVLSD